MFSEDERSVRIRVRDEFVLVTGQNGSRSLTNDAEALVDFLHQAGFLDGRRILYEDSQGTWDEMRHEGGRFAGYRFVGGTDWEDAMGRARLPWPWPEGSAGGLAGEALDEALSLHEMSCLCGECQHRRQRRAGGAL